jgi:hypothetical protein
MQQSNFSKKTKRILTLIIPKPRCDSVYKSFATKHHKENVPTTLLLVSGQYFLFQNHDIHFMLEIKWDLIFAGIIFQGGRRIPQMVRICVMMRRHVNLLLLLLLRG